MSQIRDAGASLLRRSARATAIRLGRQQQAQELLGRLREARLAFQPQAQRARRDEQAMEVVLAATLRASSNAIDVGANRGALLESILRVAPFGRHIAYEPIPALYEHLVASFPQVDVRCAALSDADGGAEFAHVVNAPAYSGLRQRTDLPDDIGEVRRISVRTERLDDALEATYVPALVKIDVEGAELHVLRGAVQTLERHRPFVLFEHGAGGADLYGSLPTELFDLLHAAGLRLFDLDGDGPYDRGRFEATFTEPIWNFLAAPA